MSSPCMFPCEISPQPNETSLLVRGSAHVCERLTASHLRNRALGGDTFDRQAPAGYGNSTSAQFFQGTHCSSNSCLLRNFRWLTVAIGFRYCVLSSGAVEQRQQAIAPFGEILGLRHQTRFPLRRTQRRRFYESTHRARGSALGYG
jgi:hypothetical protein